MPQLYTNNARALLTGAITNVATSFTIEASKADLFPTANTGTGSIPSTNNWFKATLQDSAGNVEIVYVRTRASGSAVMSNVIRGQEGTTALAFAAGSVCGLRVTAADMETVANIAGSNTTYTGSNTFSGTNSFTANNTFSGTNTFTNTIVGSINGNAATVTNGVYTTGAQTIAGVKTFSNQVNGLTAGSTTTAAFNASSSSGSFLQMNTRFAPFRSAINHSGSSYAPGFSMTYEYTGLYSGVYSLGHLTLNTGNAGAFCVHHINSSNGADYVWQFQGTNGDFISPGNVSAYSDERLKTDWSALGPGFVEALANVKNGTYTRIDSGERQIGVSAQSLQNVAPEGVIEGESLSVAYGNVALAAAVELAREIVALKAEIAALKGRA